MPTVASLLSSSPPPQSLLFSRPRHRPVTLPRARPPSTLPLYLLRVPAFSTTSVVVSASSSSEASSDGLDNDPLDSWYRSSSSSSKKSLFSNLIHEIEPLDVSLIQKDVPPNTVDAMKRTVSGMLGLLPSDQFSVMIEAFWEPLFKLLVSSMMTGYTLRNAEYRLCLERNLDIYEDNYEKQNNENEILVGGHKTWSEKIDGVSKSSRDDVLHEGEVTEEDLFCEKSYVEGLGEMTSEARDYIFYLQSRLSSTKKELHEMKQKNAALQMQHFVGEEKNDLLDYLRSLQPEKVVELSESCPELKETVHSVVHGLLATLSPKIHSVAPPQSENATGGTLNTGGDDCAELLENAALKFQPLISVPRDYLARLLFWCMLLGHYLRGLEYKMELMHMLTLSAVQESVEDDSLLTGS
ncbi:hypothetical protein QJS10_CPA02g00352 [Acorus calamus]|uniref:MAR-binding filament-like protein 1 n=1 Tax=Acorus calamus TaxID=4465 RepID=A0AAV9FDD8_ACOCL|nr:hypothetical protein QJS10_CPA02g00352 [Acorus calamus]